MPFIDTVAPKDATDQIRAMYERQQSFWGFVPNYAKVFCHRPEVMTRWAQLIAEIKRPMDPRLYELATFAAALELRSSACALAHGKKLSEWLEPADIRAVARDDGAEALSDADRALVSFARKVARDASRITAGDVAALRTRGFSDADVFDIAATAAARAFFTKVLDALGVEPDSPLGQLDPVLKDSLTVGRPIDFRAPEVMPV
jgi:uncharacterized peroxidase-related enzyme